MHFFHKRSREYVKQTVFELLLTWEFAVRLGGEIWLRLATLLFFFKANVWCSLGFLTHSHMAYMGQNGHLVAALGWCLTILLVQKGLCQPHFDMSGLRQPPLGTRDFGSSVFHLSMFVALEMLL